MLSIKKKQVAATIEIEMIQKEMATGSLGLRNPCKSGVEVNEVEVNEAIAVATKRFARTLRTERIT
jgi:hypothetical protein